MIRRLTSELFDKLADMYQAKQNAAAPTMPDLSDKPISHLVSEEEKRNPAKFYNSSDKAPDIKFKSHFRLPCLEILDGEFESSIKTPFSENNTVYVKYFRRIENKNNRPTVVMLHGWRMNNYAYFDWWCWRFAAWGLDSILIDLPYHIRRTPKGTFSGQLMLTADKLWSLVSLKQAFQDVQQLVNYLKSKGNSPIGMFGVSFGGFLSGLYICQADNADFAIMGMPPMDTIDVLCKTHLGEELKTLEVSCVSTVLSDPDIPAVFNLSSMKPRIPTKNIFIAMGIYDRIVTPESVEETAKSWGGVPWLRKYYTGHINTFVLNPSFRRDVHRFIRKEILNHA